MLRLLLLLALLGPALRAQPVHFVDADAAGANTGTSWADAFPDLQDALAAAQPDHQVWVAEGTYRPTTGTDRLASFRMKSGVALYGGFDGTETGLDERDWRAHETILSGDIGTPGVKTDNSYHVVLGGGGGATAVLDGFTVTHAYADGALPHNRGGGMRNVGGSPTVRHCVFRDNEARNANVAGFGAGMFNDAGSSPALLDVRFERNVSEGAAGGMANRNDSHPTLRDVVFLENEAGQLGGGMTNDSGSSPLLVDVRFERNRTDGWTGGMDNYQNARASLYNVVFVGNVAGNYGGGMTNDTGADVLLVNVLFVGNVAQNGGGAEPGAGALQNNGSNPTLVGVTFTANEAASGAGALGHRGDGTVTLRSSVLWDNGTELVDETTTQAFDVDHALIEGGFPPGSDVIDADPEFVRLPSPGADAAWGTADDDYGDLRLQDASPAVEAGDAAHLPPDLADLDGDGDTTEAVPFDLQGGPRLLGAALDLGAYEGGVIVSTEPDGQPSGVGIGAVYPNPARGRVTIPFTLADPAPVTLCLVDALGREVARLVDGPLARGAHTVTWPTDALAAGLYIVVLQAGAFRAARPVVIGS